MSFWISTSLAVHFKAIFWWKWTRRYWRFISISLFFFWNVQEWNPSPCNREQSKWLYCWINPSLLTCFQTTLKVWYKCYGYCYIDFKINIFCYSYCFSSSIVICFVLFTNSDYHIKDLIHMLHSMSAMIRTCPPKHEHSKW